MLHYVKYPIDNREVLLAFDKHKEHSRTEMTRIHRRGKIAITLYKIDGNTEIDVTLQKVS